MVTTLLIVSIIMLEPTRGLFVERILIKIEVHDIGILVAALRRSQILVPNLLAAGSALLVVALELKMRLLPREKLNILPDQVKTRLNI